MPTPGKTPLELLSGKDEKSFLWYWWAPATCAAFGYATVCVVNWGIRRPMHSGIQKHVLAALAGGFIGKTIDGWRNDWVNERDAVLKHYISLHPEDFPTPMRYKYSELFEPWVPIR